MDFLKKNDLKFIENAFNGGNYNFTMLLVKQFFQLVTFIDFLNKIDVHLL